MKNIKIAFFGTWEFSANILKSLIKDFKDDIDVKLVVSQPDKPVGRKKILEKTPVKIVAEENNIECLQPNKLKISNKSGQTHRSAPTEKNVGVNLCVHPEEFFEKLNSLNLDFIVVVAYGKIVPKEVLDAPKYGCINIHWSILPKYRWASPIQESLKNWDTKTGLTIMYMSEWMDEGDILQIKEIEIWEDDKTPDLFKKFEEIWPKLLVDTLKWVLSWEIKAQKQEDLKASYCSKIKKEDWEISFENETWEQIYNKFRAYYTWPWIYTYFKWKKLNLEEVELINYNWEKNIWEVDKLSKKEIWIVCKDNKILLLKQLKLEWKKSIDILSFVNWNKDFLNYKFD